jgi:hypothetical protein
VGNGCEPKGYKLHDSYREGQSKHSARSKYLNGILQTEPLPPGGLVGVWYFALHFLLAILTDKIMKNWRSLFFISISLMMVSCYEKYGEYTCNVENRLPYSIEVRSKSGYSTDTSSIIIKSDSLKTILIYGSKAANKDVYTTILSVFYSLNIYRADTLLIKRDMTARKEWTFSQTGNKDATYLLIIDQDDLK